MNRMRVCVVVGFCCTEGIVSQLSLSLCSIPPLICGPFFEQKRPPQRRPVLGADASRARGRGRGIDRAKRANGTTTIARGAPLKAVNTPILSI